MRFRLIQNQKTKTKFQVLDERGTVCGSICVEENEISDLLRHWHVAVQSQPQAQAPANSMVAAMLKHKRPLSPAAVLRGC